MNSYSIPIDLIVEILSRLPVKSVSRFRCVSKQWESILGRRPYFKELFLTRSSAKPCLLFAIEEYDTWSFFSLPQRQNPYENPSLSSSLVPAAEFQINFPGDDTWIHLNSNNRRDFECSYASGLICFDSMTIKEKNYNGPVVFNPNTNRYLILPYKERDGVASYSFLGFDPIDKQFKVLFMASSPSSPDDHGIITLGTEMTWRKIECSLRHDKKSEGICINGVLYYLGDTFDNLKYVIVCFDVRYEKFKFIIDVKWLPYKWLPPYKLINYKGKLSVVYHDYNDNNVIKIDMWVLEDVEKQEWLKYSYTYSEVQFFHYSLIVVGVTVSGEIVFSRETYVLGEPFYVFYFNPGKNTLQSVEIQGFGEYLKRHPCRRRVYTFVDHVEDLNVKLRFEKEKSEKEKIETIIEDRFEEEKIETIIEEYPLTTKKFSLASGGVCVFLLILLGSLVCSVGTSGETWMLF